MLKKFPIVNQLRKLNSTSSGNRLSRFMSRLMVIGGLFAFTNGAIAQVTGTKTIGVDYATIAAAVTDLNTVGVGSGGATINVPAGYTETAPGGGYLLGSATLNASLGSANQLIFQKSGTGANPIITAYAGSGTADGLFRMLGVDYVTIDGIDLKEAVTNTTNILQMEYGYGLLRRNSTAPFDGCQYNTIKNCSVSLSIATPGTFTACIYSNIHTSGTTTLLTLTAVGDANSYNKIYGNTLKNARAGIYFHGFGGSAAPGSAFIDQGNELGNTGKGNIINNFTSSSTTSYTYFGIYAANQKGVIIRANTIDNYNSGTGIAPTIGTVYGIFHIGSVATAIPGTTQAVSFQSNYTIENNNVTITNGTGSSTSYGIYTYYMAGDDNMNGNVIKLPGTGLTSGVLYGIYDYYHITYGSVHNFTNNIFGNFTANSSSTLYGLYTYYWNAATVNVTGNQFVNVTRTGNSTGTTYPIYAYSTANYTTAGTTLNYSGNTISNYDAGTSATSGAFYGYYYSCGQYTTNFYNNTFSNINCRNSTGTTYGYYYGYYATNLNIYDNTFSGISTAGGIQAIYVSGYYNATTNIYRNKIFNNTLTGAYANYGIYIASVGSGSSTANIYSNKIYGLQATGANGSSVNGMYFGGSYAHTANIYNNILGGLNATNSTLTSDNVAGIYVGFSSAVSANLYNNTIYLTGAQTPNGRSSAVYHNVGSSLQMKNNILVNLSTHSGTGLAMVLSRSGTSLTTTNAGNNSNLLYAGIPSATRLIHNDGTNSHQTLAAYQTFSSREGLSLSYDPTSQFLSTTPSDPNFGHITTTVSSGLESAGSSIALFTNDFDGDIRFGNTGYTGSGTAYDIGADEFEGMPSYTCSAPNPGNTVSSLSSLCLGATVNLSLQNAISGTGNTFQWQSSTNGTAWSNVLGGNASTLIVSPTSRVFYRCNVTCLNGPSSATSNSVTLDFQGSITSATNASRCGTGTVNLSATGSGVGNTFDWWTAQTGGTLVGSGGSFTSPILTGSTTYYVGYDNISPSSIVTGTGTSTSQGAGSPYYSFYEGYHMQVLFTAAELQALNLTAGPITKIRIPTTTAPSGFTVPMTRFHLRVGHTSLTNLGTAYATTLSEVFAKDTIFPTAGNNDYTFTTPFNWDGTSNLVFDWVWDVDSMGTCTAGSGTCYNGSTAAPQVPYTTTSFTSVRYYNADNSAVRNLAADFTNSSSSIANRPNISIFGNVGCLSARTPVSITVIPAPTLDAGADQVVCNNTVATLSIQSPTSNFDTYTWSPAAFLYSDAAGTVPYVAGTSTTTVYARTSVSGNINFVVTGTVVANGCVKTDTVGVFTQPGSASVSASQASLCISGTTTLNALPASGYAAGSFGWNYSADNTTYTAISGANSSSYTTPTITSSGYYQFRVGNTAGGTCLSPNYFILVKNPIITAKYPGSRCGTGTVNLGARGTNNGGSVYINWYNSPTDPTSGIASLRTDSNFTTPTISATRKYYVTASDGGASYSGGRAGYTSTDGTNTSGAYLIFDALTPFVLSTVDIYPYAASTTAGTVTISLANSAGTVLQSTTVNVTGYSTPTRTTVPLNFSITPGTAYRLVYTSSSGVSALYREYSTTVGISFPYNIGSTATITNGSLAGYYYYFYNWVVSTGCASAVDSVQATVTPAPAFAINGPYSESCNNAVNTLSVTSNLANYSSYTWSPTANLFLDVNCTVPYTAGTNASTVYAKTTVAGRTTYACLAEEPSSGCSQIDTIQINNLPALGSSTFNVVPAFDCASQNVINVTPNYTAPLQTWYYNDFSSATLNATQAQLYNDANIINGALDLNLSAGSSKGGIIVKNPNGYNAKAFTIDFDLTTVYGNGNADGFSYSFGDSVTGSPLGSAAASGSLATSAWGSNPENGSGLGLRLSFDAYANGANTQGIYLSYNSPYVNPTPSTPGVLGYVTNTTWFSTGTTTKHVQIVITDQGTITVYLNGTAIFNNIQLPPSYLVANKSTWGHAFCARTGSVYEIHRIDNFNVRYNDLNYFKYSIDGGSTYQYSNIFNVPVGTYPVVIAYTNNPTCTGNLGNAVVNTPVYTTITTADTICYGGFVTPTLSVSPGYSGATYQWQSAPKGSTVWTNISGATSATYTPTLGTVTTSTQYRCVISCSGTPIAGSPSVAKTVEVVNPQILTVIPATRCGYGTTTLKATASVNSKVRWYTTAAGLAGGAPVYVGNNFTTPAVGRDTNYYVTAAGSQIDGNVGINNFTYYSYTTTTTYGLQFSATNTFVLNSVMVYPYATTARTPGTVTIALFNAGGTMITSTTANVEGNPSTSLVGQRVALGWNVPQGTGYVIRMIAYTGINGLCYNYNSGNFTYPYTLNGIASITAGWIGSASSTYYNYFYDWSCGWTCETTPQQVHITVTAPPAITVSSNKYNICPGDSATLRVQSNSVANFAFTWSTGSTSSMPVVKPTSSTTYYVSANYPLLGCTSYDSVRVAVNATPVAIAVNPPAPATCAGTTQKLKAVGGNIRNYVNVGTATTNSTSYPNPYYSTFEGYHVQMLFKASELTAAGVVAGQIEAIRFTTTTVSAYDHKNYRIRMANTSAVDLASSYVSTGITQVYENANVIPTLGVNTYNFANKFTWDGSSNVVVDFVFDNDSLGTCSGCWTGSAGVNYTATSYTSTRYYYADNTSTPATPRNLYNDFISNSGSSANRPNITFYNTVTNTISWSPATGLYTDSLLTTPYVAGANADSVYFNRAATSSYTVTCSNASGCNTNSYVTVSVAPIPTALLSPSTTIGIGASTDLKVQYQIGATSYNWQKDGIDIAGATSQIYNTTLPGIYRIRMNGGNGCNSFSGNDTVSWPTPTNDDPVNAVALTSAQTCTYGVNYTTVKSTATGITSCNGVADDDVWYKFQAQYTEHQVTVSPQLPSTTFDPVIQVINAGTTYSASSVNSGTSVACVNATGSNGIETATLTGLTIGNWYAVRVYHAATGNTGASAFKICLANSSARNFKLSDVKTYKGATNIAPRGVAALVTNLGPANYTGSLSLSYTLNGGAATTQSFSVNLNPGDTTTLSFTTKYTPTTGSDQIAVYSNFGMDLNRSNDTVRVTFNNTVGQYGYAWAKSAGGSYGSESGLAIATDPNGNSAVVGNYYQMAIFGADTIKANPVVSEQDIYVVKFDTLGNVVWVRSAGGMFDDHANGVAVDATGNVYVTGSYTATATFGTQSVTSVGGYDNFIAKYNANGVVQFVVSYGGAGSDQVRGIAASPSGSNIAVCGWYSGSTTIGTSTFTSNGTEPDIYFASFDGSTGAFNWARSAGGSRADVATSVAVDTAGNIYGTGYYCNNSNISGPWNLVSSGIYNAFVVKYSNNGTLGWATNLYGRQDEIGTGIAVDNSGNSYVSGYFNDNISLTNSNFIPTYGNTDYFVAKFNTNGSPLWLRTGGGSGTDMARGIAVSSTGDAIITGYYQNSANFQGYILSSNASGDAFVEYLDANGNFTWVSTSSGSSSEYANGVAVSSTKSVYVTGGFTGATTFGVNNITSRGGSDMFIAKLISGGGLMQGGAQYKGALVNRTLPVTTEALVPMNMDWFVYNASFSGNTLELAWKPSAEINDAFYIVEQTVDGINYTTLATVAANQVYNPAYTYTASINKAMLSNGSIRVRIQNAEGLYAVTYSASVKLNNNSDISMLVYPNPAKDIFTVQLSKDVNDANVVIYSMDGKVVRNLVLNGTGRTAEISVSDLASGMYLVKVVVNGEVLTKRISVQH